MSPLFFGRKLARKESDPWNSIMQEMRPVGAADWPFVPLVHFVLLFAHQEIFTNCSAGGPPGGGGEGIGGGGEGAENRMRIHPQLTEQHAGRNPMLPRTLP